MVRSAILTDRFVWLDADAFERELDRTGATARAVANLARLDETQLSQARHSRRRLRLSTVRRIAAVLDGCPDVPAYVADLVATRGRTA